MGRRHNRRRRRTRKKRSDDREVVRKHTPRHRGNWFFGKARSGDAAEVSFKFSGIPIPIADPTKPADLDTLTKMANLNKGTA